MIEIMIAGIIIILFGMYLWEISPKLIIFPAGIGILLSIWSIQVSDWGVVGFIISMITTCIIITILKELMVK